jgi:hypothetical protein
MKKAGIRRRPLVNSTTAIKGFLANISDGKTRFTVRPLRLYWEVMPDTSIEASIKETTRYTRLLAVLMPARAMKIVERI